MEGRNVLFSKDVRIFAFILKVGQSHNVSNHTASEGAYTQLNLSDTVFPLDLVSKCSW